VGTLPPGRHSVLLIFINAVPHNKGLSLPATPENAETATNGQGATLKPQTGPSSERPPAGDQVATSKQPQTTPPLEKNSAGSKVATSKQPQSGPPLEKNLGQPAGGKSATSKQPQATSPPLERNSGQPAGGQGATSTQNQPPTKTSSECSRESTANLLVGMPVTRVQVFQSSKKPPTVRNGLGNSIYSFIVNIFA
jgi:hypothetical protein